MSISNSVETNIYSVLKHHAQEFPQKPLLTIDNQTISYGDFLVETETIASALSAMKLAPNQKIGIILPNSHLWYKIFWAIIKIGAQPVPLDPQIGTWEMARLFNLTSMETCFVARKYRQNHIIKNIHTIREETPSLKNIIVVDKTTETDEIQNSITFQSFKMLAKTTLSKQQTSPTDTSNVLMLACTSGSTGDPKVIVVPQQGFYKAQKDMADYLGFGPSDVMLLGMPLYHQGGFGMGLQMILNGGTVFYQPTFEPVKFLELIEQHKITAVQLTATLAKIILSIPDFDQYDLSSLHLCYFAGERLPMEVARVFFEEMNIRVVNIIGSTETGTMVIWDSLYDTHVDVNNFRTLPFTAMKILDDSLSEVSIGQQGTIFIHTEALLNEYYKNEKETARRIHWFEGKKWFDTGDLGEKCPDGRVYLTGRAKRIIKRGANLIYPEEIESFLLTHPNIAAVAVTGQKHDLIGEMIVAHIQPKQGCNFGKRDLIEFCQGKLSAYKIPDRILIVESIPKDIGKVQFKYLKRE